MLRRILFLFVMAAMLFSGTAFAAEEDPVWAKAGDQVFRQSDYERLLAYSPPGLKTQLEENPQQKVNLVEKIFQQKILAAKARKDGLDKKDDVKEQMRYLLDDYLAGEYLKRVFEDEKKKILLKEDELREYYRANANIFMIPEQVKTRHILIKVSKGASEEKKSEAREKAKEIHRRLKQGEDFEKLAEQYSEDTATKGKGGDLGYLLRGQMEKPFDEAAFSLKPGEFSYLVETSHGYHIIFSEAHIKERLKTFDEVRDFIDAQVRERIADARLNEIIKKESQDAGLEIYKDRILGKTAGEKQE